MNSELLNQRAKQALTHIRNYIVHNGRMPSIRELTDAIGFKSSRTGMRMIEELIDAGFLERKVEGGFKLIKDLQTEESVRTILIPLVGIVACGVPLLAVENVEAMIPVSASFVRSGSNYFLLRARGDSMDKAGIYDGDLILVKQQQTAEDGQKVVALLDDEATVKFLHRTGDYITLMPKSSNSKHQPIIVTSDMKIQGVVEKVIPKVTN